MKKRICILLSGKIIFYSALGQAGFQATLLNKSDSSRIPYATVKILHKPAGTSSDEGGLFQLPAEPGDTLLISSIGFKDTLIPLANRPPDIFYLSPVVKELAEVIATKKILLGTETLGITQAENDFDWGPSGLGEEFAQLIRIPRAGHGHYVKVVKVSLLIKRFDPAVPVLLHIYTKHVRTGLPDQELLLQPVLVAKKDIKKGKIVINLSDSDVYIEEEDIFVGFQWLRYSGTGKRSMAGTLLKMTNDLADVVTYSRTYTARDYHWFPAPLDPAGNRPGNTMFSIEIERY